VDNQYISFLVNVGVTSVINIISVINRIPSRQISSSFLANSTVLSTAPFSSFPTARVRMCPLRAISTPNTQKGQLLSGKLSSMLVQLEAQRDGNSRKTMMNMHERTRAILHLDLDAFSTVCQGCPHNLLRQHRAAGPPPIPWQARHRGRFTRSAWSGGHRFLRGPQVRRAFGHAEPHGAAPLPRRHLPARAFRRVQVRLAADHDDLPPADSARRAAQPGYG
jgi:hypothetical protein